MLSDPNVVNFHSLKSVVFVDVLYADTADDDSDGGEPVLKKSTAALGFSESVCRCLMFLYPIHP